MVFSTDSDLSYIYLQYKSEKVYGLLVWVGKTRNTLCIGKCCRDCVSHNVVQEFNGSRCQIKICFAFQTKPIEHRTIPSLGVIAVSVLRTPVLK